jgi:hypothetical protein
MEVKSEPDEPSWAEYQLNISRHQEHFDAQLESQQAASPVPPAVLDFLRAPELPSEDLREIVSTREESHRVKLRVAKTLRFR